MDEKHEAVLVPAGLGPRRPPGAVTWWSLACDAWATAGHAEVTAGDAVTFPMQVPALGQHVTALCTESGGCSGALHPARDPGALPEPQAEGQAGRWPLGRRSHGGDAGARGRTVGYGQGGMEPCCSRLLPALLSHLPRSGGLQIQTLLGGGLEAGEGACSGQRRGGPRRVDQPDGRTCSWNFC